MQPQSRLSAPRVFIGELLDTTISFKEDDSQFAPKFILTPTGAKCSRVLIVGTLIQEARDVGGDQEAWRIDVADSTGGISCRANEYSRRAMLQMKELTEVPCHIAVYGKPGVFQKEGKTYVNINVESVLKSNKDAAALWTLETAKATLERIALLQKSDVDPRRAMTYGTDMSKYAAMAKKAVMSLSKTTTGDDDEVDIEVIDVN